MTDFLESPRFPACAAYGYTSDPEYRVVITRRASGVEKRNRAWAYPLVKLTVTVGPRAEAEIQEVIEFWHAVGGQATGFRFKDYADFKSCQIQNDPLATDQPLVELPDSPGTHQLVKRYQFGALTQDRPIYKPVSGTILLSGAGTVDYTTGQVTGASDGDTWGGEFDVPARFDSGLPIELVNLNIESVTFALQELRMNGSTG